MYYFVSFLHNAPAGDMALDNIYEDPSDEEDIIMNEERDMAMDNIYEDEEDIIINEERASMENNTAWCDSDEEYDSSPISTLDILNRFCLKIKEEALISTRAMDRIREVTISLLKSTAVQAKRQVCKILQKHGIDSGSIAELDDVFSPSSWQHGSCELSNYGDWENCFPNLSPKERTLGTRRQWKQLKNGKYRIIQCSERFYYVSLIASLEVLLNNRKILDMVAEPRVSEPHSTLLIDFVDGTVVQQHELFSFDHQSLKIILYYDDLEITNEQTKRKHKLSLFYFQLANIYPEYRSKLKSINLLAIVEYRYLKKYGLDEILKPFVEELITLGSDMGYDFHIHNGIVRLRGALLAVIADTPACNFLGGYKEGVGGARRKCRHCMADFDEMQTKFEEEEFVLRTKELHEYHLQQLEENEGLRNHFSKEYGVNKKSILLNAPYFDVTEQLPQDVMHIVLEGGLQRTFYFVLNHFLENNFFSLEDLNAFIVNFNYGYSELKDKPVVISLEDLQDPAKNLGQTAAQIWLLSRVFPFFGESYAHHCPDVWKVFTMMLEITAICLSKNITINILGYLRLLIKGHLQLFKDVFNQNITPKQHYLVHLPTQIIKFGPTVRAWAMRFEAKHQTFKKIPKVTKDYKNLPKTLSERHQSGVRADSIPLVDDDASDHPLFRGDFTVGRGSTFSRVLEDRDREAAARYIERFYPTFAELSEAIMFQVGSVTVHGTCYKADLNTILLAEMGNSLPVFASLMNIWVCETYVFFGLKLYETVEFASNLHAYEIKEEEMPSGLFVVEIKDLVIPSVMHIYKHDGCMYICPREDPNALVDD